MNISKPTPDSRINGSRTNTNSAPIMTSEIMDALQLVDFTHVEPKQLQQEIEQALSRLHAFLDTLTVQDQPTQQALDTIMAFDHLNIELERHWGILSHLNSVMSDDITRASHHAMLPKLSAFTTRVGQHQPLYALYQQIKDDAGFFAALNPARQRAIELACQRFELSGVALPSEQQAEYAQIQSRLSVLSARFADNVLDATQAYALALSDEQLAGIPDSGLALLKAAADTQRSQQSDPADPSTTHASRHTATLDVPVYLTIMTHADDRDLREQLYRAYVTRASEFTSDGNKHDSSSHNRTEDNSLNEPSLNNADIMVEILRLRTRKAALVGFDNYAELSLSTKMAEDVAQVEQFLRQLADKATTAAQQDLIELEQMAVQYGMDTLQPWDVAYLAEKVKQHSYALSQEQIRAYFPLPKVIDGLFAIVQRLYGIRILECSDAIPRWHPDVRFYQLFDGDNTLIGGFYFDLYARTGKRGGAWMSGFQPRHQHPDDTMTQLPVCFMVANFSPAIQDSPSLLTHDEVLTLFHEFGHGLHHLLTEVGISDVAGVNGVEWDAVELPSQFMENWAWHPDGIALISRHVDTGETLPNTLLNALLAAKNFQSGMQTLRQIEFALFDLLLHANTSTLDYAGILALLNSVRDDIAIMTTPDYNRFANAFSHIFAGGYAAGYYSYKWAELLSADAFSKFEEDGIFNAATGQAFRDTVLSVGGSLPAKINFENFRGRTASMDALLRHSGFVADAASDTDTDTDTDKNTTANVI